ncbi:hypothetical protein [Winslowiella iniecta]|uniref:hypothetical protein n=1 Tax=Winslowiella iniecta TaxID=1560201 RepID=UPI000AE79DC2|nr:hypothetical protein [Winslowiella iniecta]
MYKKKNIQAYLSAKNLNEEDFFSARNPNKNTFIIASMRPGHLLTELITFLQARKYHWKKKSPRANQTLSLPGTPVSRLVT